MKKKVLLVSVIFAILVMLFTFSVSAIEPLQIWDVSATSDDNVTAYLYNDQENDGFYTITISGTGNMQDWSTMNPPWEQNYKTKIKSLLIEDGITRIGSFAFRSCTSLSVVKFGSNLCSIGNDAFTSCNITDYLVNEANQNYSSVDGNLYSKDEKTLISYAAGKQEEHFIVPSCVETIGKLSFNNCRYLSKITFPQNVTTIEVLAVYDCSQLKCAEISSSVVTIGANAFLGCDKLTVIAETESAPSGWNENWIPNGIPVVWGGEFGATVVCMEKWDISATENDNVTAYLYLDINTCIYSLLISGAGNMGDVNPWCDMYSAKIGSAIIEEGVTRIGARAFSCCDALSGVIIPDSVKDIGELAFSYSTITSIEIPHGVTKISRGTFYDCRLLQAAVLPESVLTIEEIAFDGCPIKNIIIPSNVTYIGDRAFYACKKLENITIPDNVVTVGECAFMYCDSLKSVMVGAGIEQIGDNSFSGCISLSNIEVSEDNERYKSINGNLYTKDGTILIQYSIGKTDKEFSIPYGVQKIGTLAFSSSQYLAEVLIPDSITIIGSSAFKNCAIIKKIIVPNSVKVIENMAFYNCGRYSFYSIVLPSSIETIGESVFDLCLSLTVYAVPASAPDGWSSLPSKVVWDYKNTLMGQIFTFKGYSFGTVGQMAIGFDIDYYSIELYESLTDDTLEMGVIFAGYDKLGGNQPLDENGKAITLDTGMVVKADLSNYTYSSYDFMLFDITDSISDIKLVIAAYLYDGEVVKYVQENGLSDTVTGVTYNEVKESIAE